MQPRKIALTAVLIGALCSGSYVLGQQNAEPDDTQTFAKELDGALNSLKMQRWVDAEAGARKVAELSKSAVGNRPLTDVFVSQIMARHYSDADPKAQVRLQSLQIAQNQRIIELLESLNAKKN